MKIKVIFLLFVVGAVAVPTEKADGESNKKEKKEPKEPVQEIRVPCPPKNLTDTEKVHFLISFLGGPSKYIPLDSDEYIEEEEREGGEEEEGEEEGEEEAEESPKPSEENHDRSDGFLDYGDSRLYDAGYAEKFYLFFKGEMKRQNSTTQEKFDCGDKKIEREEEKYKKQLKEKWDNTYKKLITQQKEEVEEAVKKGKDRQDIEECFDREKLDFRSQMDGEYKSALKCVKEAAVEARITLKDSRNAFTETNKKSSSNAEDWSKKVGSCVGENNGYCVQKKITDIRKEINKLEGESKKQLENLEKTLKNTEEKMGKCIKDFDDKLEKGKGEYITKMRTCLM